ncbi:2-oxo acid dehydrogenase subunit E2 [Nakamurella sp. PAMC28650]|uniref:2-oxo acid dehydrogenase subunit E2 n=1 Tax=Nakamurella sp. PAMC28650 TaxID=2762325 RepID=UPI00164D86F4|nr:2-oxo acid dehydrogenase subunit E2 [Nakamurella sp. PAMC28650]QNK81143.1 2-oxo acid dehydrogenase subunit E2 [Nakamurella sp. PAMC28650]
MREPQGDGLAPLLDLRAQINQDVSGRVSVNDFVIKAVARAHMLVPVLNVSYHDETIRHYTDVDVAVAIAAPTGLLTPVVRAADARSIREIGATVRQFVGQAASGQLRQHQLEGGSITVSNLGIYGVQEFAAIINPPQASILAVGAIRPEVTVRKGKVRPANMMHLTLSVDHRAVDGAQAAEWMAALLALLEHPLRLVVG